MKTKYHTNHYPDTYSTYSQYGEKITMVELTLGCFQMIPKTFEIPGIVDDPNMYSDDERYIFDLLLRIINVSVQTVDLVNSLPPLEIIDAE